MLGMVKALIKKGIKAQGEIEICAECFQAVGNRKINFQLIMQL